MHPSGPAAALVRGHEGRQPALHESIVCHGGIDARYGVVDGNLAPLSSSKAFFAGIAATGMRHRAIYRHA